MFEYITQVGFSGSHGAKTHYGLVLFWARALQSSLFCYVFFHGVCKPCNEPGTSGDWTHKYHNTAILFITRFLYWTFLYLLCYILLSLIGIFFRYLFVLTYFDSSRRHTHATTHATGTQIVRAKMTSLDAIFCRGNNSSSRSLARFYRRKHKKSKSRAFRGNSDEASVSCPQLFKDNHVPRAFPSKNGWGRGCFQEWCYTSNNMTWMFATNLERKFQLLRPFNDCTWRTLIINTCPLMPTTAHSSWLAEDYRQPFRWSEMS